MPVERSKKAINAWATFLATKEGQEGLKWLSQQRPTTVLSEGPHIFNWSHGRIDEFLRVMDLIENELPVPPETKKQDDEPGLIPTA